MHLNRFPIRRLSISILRESAGAPHNPKRPMKSIKWSKVETNVNLGGTYYELFDLDLSNVSFKTYSVMS